jgi:hypothetical protein
MWARNWEYDEQRLSIAACRNSSGVTLPHVRLKQIMLRLVRLRDEHHGHPDGAGLHERFSLIWLGGLRVAEAER